MAALRQLLSRLISFRHGRAEDELSREVNAHLALLEEKFLADGVTAEEARLAARRAFDGVEQVKEQPGRDRRRVPAGPRVTRVDPMVALRVDETPRPR